MALRVPSVLKGVFKAVLPKQTLGLCIASSQHLSGHLLPHCTEDVSVGKRAISTDKYAHFLSAEGGAGFCYLTSKRW